MFDQYRYRGRHRAPTTTATGRTVVRAAVVGAAIITPLALAGLPAQAGDVLSEIVRCESGGDPTAQNAVSSASGLYQMIDGTWHAYGGTTAHARQASVAEQTAVARRLLAAEGTAPWNASRACWAGRVSTPQAPRQPVQRGVGGTYVVQRGDTLGSIATRHHESWQALWQANAATVQNPHRIFPGQRLSL